MCFGALFQYPNTQGDVNDLKTLVDLAKANNAYTAVATDLLALTLLEAPGVFGVDIAFGSAQRFGVPMGFGGPHAAFFAARDDLKRQIPGRIIGVSVDSNGNRALRMAMQTREQHIRREKATSNICTAQALLANMASFYAVYHGPQGLTDIAKNIHRLTQTFAAALTISGHETNAHYFDTLRFQDDCEFGARAAMQGYNVRRYANGDVGVSFDEGHTIDDVASLVELLAVADFDTTATYLSLESSSAVAPAYQRKTEFLTHTPFFIFTVVKRNCCVI